MEPVFGMEVAALEMESLSDLGQFLVTSGPRFIHL